MPTTKIRGNTQIESGTITDAEIAANAAIANSKLAGDPTPNATANKIVLRDANGRAQIADPSAAQDIATKNYVDTVFANAVAGLDVKASVRAATTGNITLSGTQTIDGVSLVAGDRVLVKNQTNGAENGIYVVASGAWSRASDADSNAEVTAGLFVWVEEGTTNADTGWVLTTNNPIVLGTTALTFAQFSGAGQIIAGAGLTKTGNQIDVGAGNGIQVNADSVEVIYGVAGEISTITPGDSAAAGTLNKAARADHKHAIAGFGTPGVSAPGDTANAGTADTFARSDHVHSRESVYQAKYIGDGSTTVFDICPIEFFAGLIGVFQNGLFLNNDPYGDYLLIEGNGYKRVGFIYTPQAGDRIIIVYLRRPYQ